MIKKFSFWMIGLVLVSIGAIFWTHWKALETLQQKPAAMEPLFQKQKTVSSLELSLEKYRRLSTSFRKASPEEVEQARNQLKAAFSKGLSNLASLNPDSEEQALEKQIGAQLAEMINQIMQVEPTFYSRDAYNNAEVQTDHDLILKSLHALDKLFDSRLKSMGGGSAKEIQIRSLIGLSAAGLLILILMISSLLRTYFSYNRPLHKLREFALALGDGKPLPAKLPNFVGPMGDIQKVIQQLSQGVETYKRDRHKFLMDVVADLKGPLKLLQAGKHLVGTAGPEENEMEAAESVRRGLAMIAGSLEDLNDIVDINLLDSRLVDNTADLSDLLSDASRRVCGPEFGKKIAITAPPIPVWVKLDTQRFERVIILVLSKIFDTFTVPTSGVSIQVSL
ncbi:MAG: hypothetical protein HYX41_02585, partial [Bdellovibrio sp.]|nr:hypothetical protein [Bdellovibrio sp.]